VQRFDENDPGDLVAVEPVDPHSTAGVEQLRQRPIPAQHQPQPNRPDERRQHQRHQQQPGEEFPADEIVADGQQCQRHRDDRRQCRHADCDSNGMPEAANQFWIAKNQPDIIERKMVAPGLETRFDDLEDRPDQEDGEDGVQQQRQQQMRERQRGFGGEIFLLSDQIILGSCESV